MLKKTVTYTDPFEGHEITEDLYFNLTLAEVTEMALIGGEGWAESLQRLSVSTDGEQIMKEFKKLLGMAYGIREGNKHIKSPEISNAFLSSEAYSVLFMELISQPDSGASFFQGIMPKNLLEQAEKVKAAQASSGEDKRPAWVRENREPTKAELDKMTKAELAEAFRAKVND